MATKPAVTKTVVKFDKPKKGKKDTSDKQAAALVKAEPAQMSISQRFNAVDDALMTLSKAPTELAPAQRAELLGHISKWGKLLDATAKVHKDIIKAEVLAQGAVVTEAGTKRMERDGFIFEVRPQKTGYDPKKVEAGLRAQGLNPMEHMTTEVSYSVDEAKLDKLVADKVLSLDETKEWKYELTYNVQAPKPVKEET